MLKWTTSAQKLYQDLSINSQTATTVDTPPRRLVKVPRSKRRATIANKENIPLITSTPLINRTHNSPLILADIVNVTPETAASSSTPERRRLSQANVPKKRRHSTVGFTIPQIPAPYAATLPKYEEEYSPSNILPTGQQLALRGLLPDAFMEKPRYFTNPLEVVAVKQQTVKKISSLSKKRKLEEDFVAIAREQAAGNLHETPHSKRPELNHTVGSVSNKMGDQTLDKLIDAILDSARKEEKKKKRRKSFNLRRRTLIKNQVEQHEALILSPSYTAGDDPCSDLSFLNCEINTPLLTTPQPVTSLMGTPLSHKVLLQLPTASAKRKDSFSLDTPVRSKLKRRSDSDGRPDTNAKKYKVDTPEKYLEIGVALPSIYV